MNQNPRLIACMNDAGFEDIRDEESYNNWEDFNKEYPDDWEAMDGDHDSAMESAGMGTNEGYGDYGDYGEDF